MRLDGHAVDALLGESDAGNALYTEQLKSILQGLRSSFVEHCFVITPSEYDSPLTAELADSQIALCRDDEDFVLASVKFRNVPLSYKRQSDD